MPAPGCHSLFHRLALLLAAMLGSGLVAALWGTGVTEAAPFELRVMSYNIHYGQDLKGRPMLREVIRIVAEHKPDLLFVQEARCQDLERIARGAGLPHRAAIQAYGGNNACMGVFSRWSLKTKRMRLQGTEKPRFFARLETTIQGKPFSLYAVHLSREGLLGNKLKGVLLEMLGRNPRLEQMESVVKRIKADERGYKLLAGDLNTVPLSTAYQLLSQHLKDAFTNFPTSLGTYRLKALKGKHHNLPDPKIDHIFHSANLRPKAALVVPKGPSDHYPVVAHLGLKNPQADR